MLASDLAGELKRAGVKVGLLWTCYGAEPDADFGSVVRAFLDVGELVAVMGSQAALRADSATTPQFTRALLKSLATTAEGHLDRSVGEARRALPVGDLQWVAALYFARPLRGQSVDDELPQSLLGQTTDERWQLSSAPNRSPNFRGRQADLAASFRDAVQAAVARYQAELDSAGIDAVSPFCDG